MVSLASPGCPETAMEKDDSSSSSESVMGKDESSRSLLGESDDYDPHVCPRCPSRTSRTRKHRIVLLCFQALLLILAIGLGFAIGRTQHFESEDKYANLTRYNTFRTSFGPNNAADNTSAAQEWWSSMGHHHGFVSLPHSDEKPVSLADPKDESKRLYQIRAFHSLHCLARLRKHIISDRPLDEWPRADPHTLHCIDHIRRDLMCSPSVTFLGTSDYSHFHNLPSTGMQCRNFDAIIDFANQNRWNPMETPDGLRVLDPPAEQRRVWEQKVQLDAEAGYQIPYDELEYTWDKDMHIHMKWLKEVPPHEDGQPLCFGKCTTLEGASLPID